MLALNEPVNWALVLTTQEIQGLPNAIAHASSPIKICCEDVPHHLERSEGVASIYLTDDTCKIISIDKTSARHGNTFKVPKNVIMDDIQMRGAISDFHPVKPQLQEIAMEADASKPPSKPEVTKREPKPWIHLGSDKEIAEEQAHTSRKLIVIRATRKRKDFGGAVAFSDRDSMETFSSGQMECRPFKDPAYDKCLAEQDIGIQSIPITRDCASQTDQYVDALQQNEVLDLFEDDFASFGEEDEHAGQKTISVITEFQAFSDLLYSKGKMISAIDWMPGKKGVVAASCSDSRAYDERLQFTGKPSNSFVLIWSFVDPIRPQIILECLSDIFSLRFNQSNPRFVAGGCYNGQVIIWDIAAAQMHMEAKEKESSDQADQGKDKEKKKAPIVICHLLSSAARSHNAIVSDLHWLPDYLQKIYISLPQAIFWNITDVDLNRNAGSDDERKAADTSNQKYRWDPALQIDLALFIGITNTFQFGEVLRADFNVPKDKIIQDISQSHFGQVRALQRSPFYEDVLLSVDIWTFALWKNDFSKPIFISRSAEGYLTCGCWSPSRPGVLYIGRIDGSIEVWDLIDHSHQPSALASIGSCQVTSMEFWPLQSPQMLAVGDIQGILHIMEIPRRLRRMVHREKSMVRKFLDRQQAWVEDVESREKERLQEIEKRQKQEYDQRVLVRRVGARGIILDSRFVVQWAWSSAPNSAQIPKRLGQAAQTSRQEPEGLMACGPMQLTNVLADRVEEIERNNVPPVEEGEASESDKESSETERAHKKRKRKGIEEQAPEDAEGTTEPPRTGRGTNHYLSTLNQLDLVPINRSGGNLAGNSSGMVSWNWSNTC
ncbi:WD repeat-containing protein 63 [Selaginella moellendorffii]|uniref:WD repeat-containing protein 63 n=1 Tax=Selaginella moellendorffii TaxID=88036 RepID=UPI000D1CA69A|nr:WD repeat-containing protein 63 [Selaginella moellendorffii]|eukprot:XP_024543144.1 WD repeat-containing protein 63 [Selaginella moellendorffii]